jgi:hypothetical protein
MKDGKRHAVRVPTFVACKNILINIIVIRIIVLPLLKKATG